MIKFKDFNILIIKLRNDLIVFNHPESCKIENQNILYRLGNYASIRFVVIKQGRIRNPFFNRTHLFKNYSILGLKLCSMFGSIYKYENNLLIMNNIKLKCG